MKTTRQAHCAGFRPPMPPSRSAAIRLVGLTAPRPFPRPFPRLSLLAMAFFGILKP